MTAHPEENTPHSARLKIGNLSSLCAVALRAQTADRTRTALFAAAGGQQEEEEGAQDAAWGGLEGLRLSRMLWELQRMNLPSLEAFQGRKQPRDLISEGHRGCWSLSALRALKSSSGRGRQTGLDVQIPGAVGKAGNGCDYFYE